MAPRTIALVALLTIALLSAGCLSGGPGMDSTEPTEDRPTSTPTTAGPTPTDDPTTPADTPTANGTVPGWEHASNQPDPSKTVSLENHWQRNVTIQLRVIRNATGETVHDETYELAPGADRDVYDTAAAEPDGIETFTIVVSARNATQSVHIETNECHGGAYASVSDDGELQTTYAIC